MTLATSLRFKLEEGVQSFSPALWFNLGLNKSQSLFLFFLIYYYFPSEFACHAK